MATFTGDASPGTNQADYDAQGKEVPGVAILISELGASKTRPLVTRWDLEIGCYTDAKGWTRVGRVLTVPPALATVYVGAGAPTGPSARVVAIVSCPGALRWRVTGRAVPLDLTGTTPAVPIDQGAILLAARADVLVAPYDVATAAIGVQAVDAGLPGDRVVTIATTQVGVAAVATQVLPEDENRVRALLRVVSGGPVFIGPNTVAAANGLPLAAGDPPLEYTPRRPLFAFDPGGAAVLAVLVERG